MLEFGGLLKGKELERTRSLLNDKISRPSLLCSPPRRQTFSPFGRCPLNASTGERGPPSTAAEVRAALLARGTSTDRSSDHCEERRSGRNTTTGNGRRAEPARKAAAGGRRGDGGGSREREAGVDQPLPGPSSPARREPTTAATSNAPAVTPAGQGGGLGNGGAANFLAIHHQRVFKTNWTAGKLLPPEKEWVSGPCCPLRPTGRRAHRPATAAPAWRRRPRSTSNVRAVARKLVSRGQQKRPEGRGGAPGCRGAARGAASPAIVSLLLLRPSSSTVPWPIQRNYDSSEGKSGIEGSGPVQATAARNRNGRDGPDWGSEAGRAVADVPVLRTSTIVKGALGVAERCATTVVDGRSWRED